MRLEQERARAEANRREEEVRRREERERQQKREAEKEKQQQSAIERHPEEQRCHRVLHLRRLRLSIIDTMTRWG